MSNNPNDCRAIEARIHDHNLYISTTQDQVNKLDSNDQDVAEQREALSRKLYGLREQLNTLQKALEDCQQGKASNFSDFEIVREDDTV